MPADKLTPYLKDSRNSQHAKQMLLVKHKDLERMTR